MSAESVRLARKWEKAQDHPDLASDVIDAAQELIPFLAEASLSATRLRSALAAFKAAK